MSRNNVFKLSGNMALGGAGADYPSNDFENIKNSLKLLKSKQSQQRQQAPLEPTNYYGGSYSSNSQIRPPQVPKNLGSYDYPSSYTKPPVQSRMPEKGYSEKVYPADDYPKKAKPQSFDRDRGNGYSKAQQQPSQAYDRQEVGVYQKAQQPTQSYERQDRNTNQRNAYQKPTQPVQSYERQENNGYGKEQHRAGRQVQAKQREEYDYYEPTRKGAGNQEKSIKQMNMDNRVEIKEYNPSELVECREGCGRKFNPDSIAKHEAVCQQVFQKKRKEFNTQKQRIVDNEQKKLMKHGEAVEKKIQQQKAKQKVPKWKAQSLQLRTGIKQAKSDDYQPTREEKQMMQAAQEASMIKCQFCGRTFNETAGQRHVPFCQAQQKKKQMRR